ncbi:hypothetical protein Ciccas_005211 [Cichlidogyrus casuarinus]|uniref:Uncharacterized protein n=1 Tax=Cichlidogyrus casuarinus TaxID=1844966 RepID=A0ABD2Q9C8_9PLAT
MFSRVNGLCKPQKCFISLAMDEDKPVGADLADHDLAKQRPLTVLCQHRKCRRIHLRLLVMKYEQLKRKAAKCPDRKRPRETQFVPSPNSRTRSSHCHKTLF